MRRVTPLIAALLVCGCSSGPELKKYELNGQILAVAPERREVTIRHQDIKDFMPGMTMPFTVKDGSLLDGKQPGDLVTATLMVGDTQAYLSTLTRVGHDELPAPPPPGTTPILKDGDLLSDEPLIDQDGASRPMASLRRHRVALTFIYTRCPLPDFCPLMSRNFAALQKALRADPSLSDVRLVSVTLDPVYDTPPVLKAHAAHFGADPAMWSFVTGQPEEIKRFGEQFGLIVEPDAKDSSQITHNLRTALISADGRLVKAYTGRDWTPTELLADLKTIPAAVN